MTQNFQDSILLTCICFEPRWAITDALVFPSCGEWGLPFIAVHQLQAKASAVAAQGLSSCGCQALGHRLGSRGTWAQLLHSKWDLPQPGIKPVSPALAGRFLTTGPPGKFWCSLFKWGILSDKVTTGTTAQHPSEKLTCETDGQNTSLNNMLALMILIQPIEERQLYFSGYLEKMLLNLPFFSAFLLSGWSVQR